MRNWTSDMNIYYKYIRYFVWIISDFKLYPNLPNMSEKTIYFLQSEIKRPLRIHLLLMRIMWKILDTLVSKIPLPNLTDRSFKTFMCLRFVCLCNKSFVGWTHSLFYRLCCNAFCNVERRNMKICQKMCVFV